MINDFKLGWKVIRYGMNLKQILGCAGILIVVGLVVDLLMPESPLNGFYTGMIGMFVVQVICSFSVSEMVQSSPYKKRLQTSVPAIFGGGILLVGNTISLLAKFLGNALFQREEATVSNSILTSAVFMVIVMLYMGGALKAFVPATVLFFVVYLTCFSSVTSLSILHDSNGELIMLMPTELAVIASYGIIILASLLMYFMLVALYKRSYSKHNFERMLQRAK